MNIFRARHSAPALLLGAAISVMQAAPASAAGPYYGLHASDCQVPGVIAWYSGNALAGGMAYNPCPNPIPLPTEAAPAAPASPPPAAAAEAPPPATDDAMPVAEETSPTPEPSAPVAVAAPPPPPQRIPVAVPTYSASSVTYGPGSNSVGGGNGTGSYVNAFNVPTPSARAAVNRTDWCHRSGRSAAATALCVKYSDNK